MLAKFSTENQTHDLSKFDITFLTFKDSITQLWMKKF